MGSNQKPADFSSIRDIYLKDLKSNEVSTEVTSLDILYPNNSLNHPFAPMNPIPIVADIEFTGVVDRVDVILNQQVNGQMNEFGGLGFTSFKSNRFTYQISNLNSGEYSLQLIAYGENGQSVATSSLIRFTVSPFDGSLPPTINLSDPGELGSVTSTSTIPFSARGEDPDGVMEKVHYYIDGNLTKTITRSAGLAESDQSYSLLLDINSTLQIGEERGFRTVFVIAEDNSNNFVASDLYTISFTKGSSVSSSVEIISGLNGFEIPDTSFAIVTDPADGGILRITPNNGLAFGHGLIEARIDILSDGNGSGATFSPTIELNPNDANYSKITGFEKVAEGSGYNASDVFTLKVTPIIRAINVGIPGELDYLRGIPQDQNATNRTDTIRTAVNPDGTLRLGSGYVVSPRLRTVPTGAFCCFYGSSGIGTDN